MQTQESYQLFIKYKNNVFLVLVSLNEFASFTPIFENQFNNITRTLNLHSLIFAKTSKKSCTVWRMKFRMKVISCSVTNRMVQFNKERKWVKCDRSKRQRIRENFKPNTEQYTLDSEYKLWLDLNLVPGNETQSQTKNCCVSVYCQKSTREQVSLISQTLAFYANSGFCIKQRLFCESYDATWKHWLLWGKIRERVVMFNFAWTSVTSV